MSGGNRAIQAYPKISPDFLRVIGCLQLERPLPDTTVIGLNHLFEDAKANPNKEFLAISAGKTVVVIFAGVAISVDTKYAPNFQNETGGMRSGLSIEGLHSCNKGTLDELSAEGLRQRMLQLFEAVPEGNRIKFEHA